MSAIREEVALYVVPTPIGNLEDITLRALKVLKEVQLILAEDTRTSGILLKHYSIPTKMQSYHAFNEHGILKNIINQLKSGMRMALITDAGTPGISDPGFLIVREALQNNLKVECLPGATAFVPALVVSGLPSDTFVFEGFLPQKKGRQTKLKSLLEEERTMIFYESPFRLVKTLENFLETFQDERKISVSRELTKLYEETFNGSIREALDYFKSKTVKGEIVIVLAGKNHS